MSASDDPERHAFLARLEQPLRARFPNGELVYTEVRPFPCLALRVDLAERGAVEVVPVSVSEGGAMGYSGSPFPGNGVAHWQVRKVDAHGAQRGRVFSCRIKDVEAALEAWTAPTPPVPELAGPRKKRDDLAALAAAKRPAFADSTPGRAFAERGLAMAPDAAFVEELKADLEQLAPERIAYFFPVAGARRSRVILSSYGRDLGRSLCLFVTCKRNVLELGLEQLIEGNHEHVWRSLRWRWDRRVALPSAEERWGLAGADERPALFLALIDEGRYGEALAAYSIEFDEHLARGVAGQRLPGSLSPHIEEWATELQEVLWTLAPWKFEAGLGQRKAGRIHLMSHQQGTHKQCVFLSRTSSGFRLYLESTSFNGTLPVHVFQRDIEQDLARFGLAAPNVPASQSANADEGEPKKARSKAGGKAEARAKVLQEKWEQGLLEVLRADNHVAHAVTHARKRSGAIVLPIVVRELASSDPRVRARSLLVAGHLLLPVGELARACLNDSELNVVRAAMDALCRLRYLPALESVADCMTQRPEELAHSGASTLRSWGSRPTDALSEHLSAQSEKLRAAAAIAIGVYRSRTHPAALLERLTSDTALVAGAALRALELLNIDDAEISACLEQRSDVSGVRLAQAHWTAVTAIG